jgi:hypothetical protein
MGPLGMTAEARIRQDHQLTVVPDQVAPDSRSRHAIGVE